MKILFLGQINSPISVGWKAYNLSVLKKEGFLVPDAFVIHRENKFSDKEKKEILKEILKLESDKIAIRSSSNVEDSNSLSWAGQFKTFLNVNIADTIDIFEKIEEIFNSINSENVLNYKKNNKIKNEIKISIIIQKMIPSEKSGVSFSINPITKNNNEILINSHFGLGDELVDGKINSDEFLISKDSGYILKKDGKSLTENELELILTQTKKIESLFNVPVDIEWAIWNKNLHLLQSRPIILDEKLHIFDNSNIAESYAGITSPLTFSFAKEAYREVYKSFARLMGVNEKEISDNSLIFESMIESIHYRFYYNLLNWYRLIALFPAYNVSQGLMENMMGVSKTFRNQLPMQKTKNVTLSYFIVFWKSLKVIYIFSTLRWKMRKFNLSFDKYYNKELNIDLSTYSVSDLEKRYRKIEKDLIKDWSIPIANDFAVMTSVGLAKKVYKKFIKQDNFYDYISIDENLISTEPSKLLIKLHKMAISEEIFNNNLNNKENLKKILIGNSKFKNYFNEYIKRYSIRVPNELKLETTTLEDNPEILIRQIRSYTDFKFPTKKKIGSEIKTIFWKKWILNFLFTWSKNSIVRREEGRFRRAQAFHLIRKLFIQSGYLLKKNNSIENFEDIFYLKVNEIFGKNIRYKEKISQRKKEIEKVKKLKLEKRYEFFTEKKMLEKYILNDQEEKKGDKKKSSFLSGKITSSINSDSVSGEVVVMENFDSNLDINNKILITKHTDPGWTPIFPLLKAIVLENGSTLSHASIVAREFKIPCIVGVENAVSELKTGEKININLTDGNIEKI